MPIAWLQVMMMVLYVFGEAAARKVIDRRCETLQDGTYCLNIAKALYELIRYIANGEVKGTRAHWHDR